MSAHEGSHAPRATLSYADQGGDGDADAVLVMFCCAEHGAEVQSVGGSRVEGDYCLASGDLASVAAELEADGVSVEEGA